MKGNRLLISLLLIIIIILVANNYIEIHRDYPTSKEPEIEFENYMAIIDKNAHDILRQEYAITNLSTENVYINNNTLYLDFYFNSLVSRSEILAIRGLVLSKFIIHPNVIIDFPYDTALSYGIDIKNINLKIYIDECMIIEEHFSNIDDLLVIDYFEDIDMELELRSIENNKLAMFSTKIKQDFKGIKKVDFEAPYKGDILSIRMVSKEKLSDEEIYKIKKIIDEDLASNVDYRGIVLLLFDDDHKYFEEGLHNNSSNKYWFSDYWGNHQFYEYNTN